MLCFCLMLIASWIALQAPAEPAPCTTQVNGHFTSKPLQPPGCADTTKPCTEGTLTGELAGKYTFTKTKDVAWDGARSSVGFYVGDSIVTLDKGNAELHGMDTGAFDEKRGGLASLITWTGGTGRMQHATGQIQVRGQFNPKDGTFTGDYAGTLCAH